MPGSAVRTGRSSLLHNRIAQSATFLSVQRLTRALGRTPLGKAPAVRAAPRRPHGAPRRDARAAGVSHASSRPDRMSHSSGLMQSRARSRAHRVPAGGRRRPAARSTAGPRRSASRRRAWCAWLPRQRARRPTSRCTPASTRCTRPGTARRAPATGFLRAAAGLRTRVGVFSLRGSLAAQAARACPAGAAALRRSGGRRRERCGTRAAGGLRRMCAARAPAGAMYCTYLTRECAHAVRRRRWRQTCPRT
jgi:hypothetical protein